ncbi:MAG TPA: isoprenylcysteine carboxylmethyltransferase family protein [Mycobacterium sp.]
MRTSTAAVGSAVFFVVAPGTFAGLIPWLITHGESHPPVPYWVVAQVIGVLLICVGLVPPVSAFVEFAKAGGTPMPIAPPRQLVVSGFNRYIRNPMYFGLLLVIIGQALLFGSLGLLAYATLAWLTVAAFVRWYEEPTLARQFGADYEAYRRAVRAWLPRMRPWTPEPGGAYHEA